MNRMVKTLLATALVVASAASMSCNVNEYCLNCAVDDGGNRDGRGSDGDVGDGDINDGPTDDSGCVVTGVEVCDDKDNDCDGQTDEGPLPQIGEACDSVLGECANGVKQCTAGRVVCSTQSAELCDSKDNNCDGTADEGDPGGGAVCGTNTGECVAGVNRCQGGAVVCVGAVGPSTESCNNRDDDCDGMFDENLSLGACVAGVDGPAQGNTGECNLGTRQCVGGVTQCTGAVAPVFEQCDTALKDSDCDGQPSNGYNLTTDPNNCGACGNICALPQAFAGCGPAAMAPNAPTCKVVACQANYFNNNGVDSDGCEFNCGHPYLGSEVCNGIDDDCDGLVDGADPDMQVPTGLCDSDGACSTGTNLTCDAAMGWRCHYTNPNVATQTTPSVNNTVIVAETRCDGDLLAGVQADNDCDGAIDEAQPNRGQACDNAQLGECRSSGELACDPANRTGPAACKFSVTGLPPATEICDGRDNNCDGVVDNGAATGALQAWADIPGITPAVQIMKYEASRPDARATDVGTLQTHVCSRDGVQPWTNIRHAQAEEACESIGARLCAESEWQTSCEPSTIYPVVGPTTTAATDYRFIEAEDFQTSTTIGTPAAQRAWTRIAPSSFGGVTAMVVPDNNFIQPLTTSALAASSRLDYQLTLTPSTAYRVFARVRAPSVPDAQVLGPATAATVTLAPTSNAATAVGDLVIVSTWSTVTNNAAVTHTLQTGFTQLQSTLLDDGNNDGRLSIAYKLATVAGAQPYQAYTVSNGVSVSGITVLRAGQFDLAALASASDTDTGTGAPNPPSAGGLARPTMVLAFGAWHTAAAATVTVGAPAGFTLDWDAAGANQGDLAQAHLVQGPSSTADPGAFSDNVTPNGTARATVAIGLAGNRSVYVGLNANTAGQASATLSATVNDGWQWVISPAITTPAGQTNFILSLYTREDGLQIDTIAIARHTTLPTFVNDWAYATNPRTAQTAPSTCNGDEYDTDAAAAGDQDGIVPTGSLASCYAEHDVNDVYDLSGNVKEWTAARAPGENPLRGGSSNNVVTGLTCKLNFTLANDAFFFPNVGFRCCRPKP